MEQAPEGYIPGFDDTVEKLEESPNTVNKLPPDPDIKQPKVGPFRLGRSVEAYKDVFTAVLSGYMATKYGFSSFRNMKLDPDSDWDGVQSRYVPDPEADVEQMAKIGRIADLAWAELRKRTRN